MLVAQEHRNVAAGPQWRQRELVAPRQLYAAAATLLTQPRSSAVVDIWRCGLSWYLWRFGLPADSATLTTAVARRICAAQALLEEAGAPPFLAAVDQLVGKAAQRLFDATAALSIARRMGLDFAELYRQIVRPALPALRGPEPRVAR